VGVIKKMIDIQKQEDLRKFVEEEVYTCQSSLVDGLLNKGIFNYEDIENYYEPAVKDDIEDEIQKEKEPQEIYEWWVVSDWLVIMLRKAGEPILNNDYGTWWGRCSTGQAILLDGVIEAIYDEVVRH
jgi:hypothetical protein